MNEETAKLIELLAAKLGTTGEYLWSVLIKQARISAITDLIFFSIIIIGCIMLWRLHIYFTNKNDKYDESMYERYEDKLIIPMYVIAVIMGLIFIGRLFSIDNLINGFFNPEYWALNKVLKFIN